MSVDPAGRAWPPSPRQRGRRRSDFVQQCTRRRIEVKVNGWRIHEERGRWRRVRAGDRARGAVARGDVAIEIVVPNDDTGRVQKRNSIGFAYMPDEDQVVQHLRVWRVGESARFSLGATNRSDSSGA